MTIDKRRWLDLTQAERDDVISLMKDICCSPRDPDSLSNPVGAAIFLLETELPRCPDAVILLRAAYDAEVERADAFMAAIRKGATP